MQNKPIIAVITPTFKRDIEVIERCIFSVACQTYGIDAIKHIIVSENKEEKHVSDYLNSYNFEHITYINTKNPHFTFGNTARNVGLEYIKHNLPDVDFICFVDGDNIIYPRYIETHVNFLIENADIDFSICKIVHNGPLPPHIGIPPKIIDRNPPRIQNIDSLQVMVKRNAMLDVNWANEWTKPNAYLADGITYENLSKKYKYGFIDKILAIHI